eukprot:GHVL01026820.1.p1 GENE.GHVL01026820.1~~GHVL01026820.1.p1  ORF type:complete len:135 (+),score=29.36 GHVL01026820.1:395-799(+)
MTQKIFWALSKSKMVKMEWKENGMNSELYLFTKTTDVWKKGVEELSGGQKSMLSIAIVLAAAHSTAVTQPLLLLDEIDAALDEEATQSLSMYLRGNICDKTQIICVSHHSVFQQHANNSINIMKKNGASRVVVN